MYLIGYSVKFLQFLTFFCLKFCFPFPQLFLSVGRGATAQSFFRKEISSYRIATLIYLHKINNRHPLQLKTSKSWETGSQLNSPADLANLAQFWSKWAGLAVLFKVPIL